MTIETLKDGLISGSGLVSGSGLISGGGLISGCGLISGILISGMVLKWGSTVHVLYSAYNGAVKIDCHCIYK